MIIWSKAGTTSPEIENPEMRRFRLNIQYWKIGKMENSIKIRFKQMPRVKGSKKMSFLSYFLNQIDFTHKALTLTSTHIFYKEAFLE